MSLFVSVFARKIPARKGCGALFLYALFLSCFPPGFLGAQQNVANQVHKNLTNQANIQAKAAFVQAFRVDVASEVKVISVPNSPKDQLFIRVNGASRKDSVIINCNIVSDTSDLTHGTSCDSDSRGGSGADRHDRGMLLSDVGVYYKKVSFTENRNQQKQRVAIDFSYL